MYLLRFIEKVRCSRVLTRFQDQESAVLLNPTEKTFKHRELTCEYQVKIF